MGGVRFVIEVYGERSILESKDKKDKFVFWGFLKDFDK